MLPQCNVRVDGGYADRFEAALRQITVAGEQLKFRRADNGFFSMEWGQANLHDCPDAVLIRGVAVPPTSIGLACVEIEERSDTTAYHVPEGIFSIYDPQDRSVKSTGRPEVSVLEIAPTILDTFGVAIPDYMQSPSLLTTAAGHSVLH